MARGCEPESARTDDRHHVVIVGGGFGGLHCARGLRRAPVRVTLLDRRNFHCFQPLLYQVATGGLSPANITAPLRRVLRRQRNARVVMAEATGIDVAGRRLMLSDGVLPYDSLVVATGSSHSYFGHDEWEAVAPGLKTVEDATRMRAKVLFAFEAAERETDPALRQAWLTFVIAGAGPTGVELAGALAEMARHTFRCDFRRIRPADARIVLADGVDRVLATYRPELSESARRSLERLGVEVRLGSIVADVADDHVVLRRLADGGQEVLPTRTVLWAAGVSGSPLGRQLANACGVPLGRGGRVPVAADCSVPDHPAIFVVGDLAEFRGEDGHPLPGIAPVAMQQGRHVAEVIRRRLDGREVRPFRYRDKGTMATIGRGKAVADLHWLRFSGPLAWLAWLFIHLMYLVQFENRLLVLVQWCWHYTTFGRNARLITGPNPLPLPGHAAEATPADRSQEPPVPEQERLRRELPPRPGPKDEERRERA